MINLGPYAIIGGTALDIFGRSEKNREQQRLAYEKAKEDEYTAIRLDIEAAQHEEQARIDEAHLRFENTLALGDMRAQFGASGVTFEGSQQEVYEQNRAVGEANAINVRYRGMLQAMAIRAEAGSYRRRAEYTRGAADRNSANDILEYLSSGVQGATTLMKSYGVYGNNEEEEPGPKKRPGYQGATPLLRRGG